jgi:hypothetical protein
LTEVFVGGLKFIKAMRWRSRELRITDREILIENLPAIPLISITNCVIRFTFLHLEFTEKDSTTTKLAIRAPLKYHFRPFPVNYADELEFVEDLYAKIIENIPEKAAFWSSFKDAIKGLDADKIIEIKRAFAGQERRKRIFSLVLVALTFLWLPFIVAQAFDLIPDGKYQIFVTFISFLIFPIMLGYLFTYVSRCPNCKTFFISSNPIYCTRCNVPLVDR